MNTVECKAESGAESEATSTVVNAVAEMRFLSFLSANSKTEGYIEGVMRNIKQDDFHAQKHLRVDAFVLENYEWIRRIMGYFDRLDTCTYQKRKRSYRQKKNGNQNPVSSKGDNKELQDQHYRNSEEKWGKRDPETAKLNPTLGQFQKSPKIPLSKQLDFENRISRKCKLAVVDTTREEPDANQN